MAGISFAGKISDRQIFLSFLLIFFVYRLEASRHEAGQVTPKAKNPMLYVSINVITWPEVIHLCMQQPVELSPEEMEHGVQIEGQNFQIIGIIHQHEGNWNVSCKAARDGLWHDLSSSGTVQVGFPAYLTPQFRIEIEYSPNLNCTPRLKVKL